VCRLRRQQGKHEIYDDDTDIQEGWKHESWVRGHYARNEFDSTQYLASQLARGEKPSSSGDPRSTREYQDAWMREQDRVVPASSPNLQQQPVYTAASAALGGAVEARFEQVWEGAEKRGERAWAGAERAGGAARGLGKDVTSKTKGVTSQVAKRFDKVTGKSFTKLGQAVDQTGAKLQLRWEEARSANLR